ncbi:MAG: spermidine/putrescine transport system substrate-binding protein, partial [Actinomycetota bacterium]|nr:spermidine/putrescine transport system substrate-binding protein [Actinomycetota bacterium]
MVKELEPGAPKIDIPLLRGLTERRVSRRDALRYAGAGAGATALAAFLAACGVSGNDKNDQSPGDAASFWDTAKKAGVLNFANWELYIDRARDKNGKFIHPSLDEFTKRTGIKVNYSEPIIENEQFFAKIQPSLSAGKDTGYDLIVITNGQTLDKLIRNDWLLPLEHSYLKNFEANVADIYKDPNYDPGNAYTIPWQSGITGIGYDPNLTGRKITSFNDLFDPAFKGKVGMFGDTLDLPNFAMQGLGINPETSTPDDWQKAADKLIEQRDAGLVRQYYGQPYIKALAAGDIAISTAWSGDIFQANASGSPQLEFVVPEEGGLIWTDNMCIPAEAQHPVDAIMMMDYVFEP